jgi:hypothetical protein
MTDFNDELLPLLKPYSGSAVNNDAFARSLRVLQSRARVHRAVKLLSLVVVLGLGIAIGWFAKPTPAVEPINPPPVAIPESPQDGSSTHVALTPDQIEQKAELSDDRSEAGKFYKLAGDAYLARQRYDEAARCYRLFVNLSRETRLVTDDSWLLSSVKITSQREINQ